MDVSEIGFRERYQTALTSKNRARNLQHPGSTTESAQLVRKSAIIPNNRNSAAFEIDNEKKSATNRGISNDYYMLAAEQS